MLLFCKSHIQSFYKKGYYAHNNKKSFPQANLWIVLTESLYFENIAGSHTDFPQNQYEIAPIIGQKTNKSMRE